jgi:hypothetical protein
VRLSIAMIDRDEERAATEYQAEMFAATALARTSTAARRATTATPARLGALRAMSSETATFDLTGSFEVRHPRRKK